LWDGKSQKSKQNDGSSSEECTAWWREEGRFISCVEEWFDRGRGEERRGEDEE